jgi:general secretion pathway protein B
MSFILDALKKSENERQRQVGPSLADVRVIRRNNERPWWVVAVAALLVVNLGALVFVLVRNGNATPAAPAQPAAATVQNAPPVQAPQQSYNTQPAQQYQQPPAPQNYQANQMPTDPSVRSLADEARDYEEPYPDESMSSHLAGAANVPEGPPMVRQIEPPAVAPLPTEAASQARVAANIPPGGGALVGNETLPTLDDLINSGTNLPEMHLDIHVNSRNPAERFVFVNMRKYVEGDTLKEGPSVERITAEGVILNQRGLRFLLPRQ